MSDRRWNSAACYQGGMILMKAVLAAAVFYGGVVALMYVMQRSLQYHPDPLRTPPAVAGLPEAREVVLGTPDGEKVIVWSVPPRDGRPLILYFHGNGGALRNRADRFRALVADGTGLVALSYRGYGGSTGRPSERGFTTDAEVAYRFALGEAPADHVVVFGESLGTGVAVCLAASRQVGRVILESPFTSAADVGAAAYPFLPVRLLMKDPFYSDRLIGKVTAPLLVLHGERDRVVPIALGMRLFALANEPKRFVRFPEGDHVDLDNYGALAVVREFLAQIPY